MTTFAEIALECPMCGTVFRTTVIASYGWVGKDTDLRPHFSAANPLPFFVHRCPECDFAAYADNFEEQEIETEGLPEDPGGPALKRYALALQWAEDSDRSSDEIGSLSLHRAWCARMEGHEQQEQADMARAAQMIATAIDAGEVEEAELAQRTYLVAELKRRCGDFEDAVRWFRRAAATPIDEDAEEQKGLRALIERQRELADAGDASNTHTQSEPSEGRWSFWKWLVNLLSGGDIRGD